jgi:hypothetical protein
MKKLISVLILCFLSLTIIGQSTDNKAEKMGLFSELVFIKSSSENFALRIVNDSLINRNDSIRFVILYNDTKTITDQVIIQLIASSKRKNNLRFVRRLDNLLFKNTIYQIQESGLKGYKLKCFIVNLKKAELIHSKLMNFTPSAKPTEKPNKNSNKLTFFPSSITGEEFTGMLSFMTSAIKDIYERKEKKVEKISEMLNDLRLVRLQELGQNPQEKPEKKEEQK